MPINRVVWLKGFQQFDKTNKKEDETMGKYILHWEIDSMKTPEDPKERQEQWSFFQATIVQHMKENDIKEWGEYVGEANGYAIIEGTEVEVQKLVSLWVPFVKFNVKAVMSIEQVMEATKAMA
jgi:hypothetical protein